MSELRPNLRSAWSVAPRRFRRAPFVSLAELTQYAGGETMPDLVRSLYERWGAAFADEPEMPLDRWRAMIEEWPQVTAEPGGVDYVEVDAGGVHAMWITPKWRRRTG